MDAFLFMILALVLTLRVCNESTKVETSIEKYVELENISEERAAKLNDFFYEDEDAFSEIIHALGFPKEIS